MRRKTLSKFTISSHSHTTQCDEGEFLCLLFANALQIMNFLLRESILCTIRAVCERCIMKNVADLAHKEIILRHMVTIARTKKRLTFSAHIKPEMCWNFLLLHLRLWCVSWIRKKRIINLDISSNWMANCNNTEREREKRRMRRKKKHDKSTYGWAFPHIFFPRSHSLEAYWWLIAIRCSTTIFSHIARVNFTIFFLS